MSNMHAFVLLLDRTHHLLGFGKSDKKKPWPKIIMGVESYLKDIYVTLSSCLF